MNLVLDTNVVMELLHWRDPRSAALLHAIDAGRARCHSDSRCLAELSRVLGYPQFGLDSNAQQHLITAYRRLVVEVAEPAPEDLGTESGLPRCRDTDDQKFLELAARCNADLLVTRDRELLKLARSRRHPAPFGIVLPEVAIARLDPAMEPTA